VQHNHGITFFQEAGEQHLHNGIEGIVLPETEPHDEPKVDPPTSRSRHGCSR